MSTKPSGFENMCTEYLLLFTIVRGKIKSFDIFFTKLIRICLHRIFAFLFLQNFGLIYVILKASGCQKCPLNDNVSSNS